MCVKSEDNNLGWYFKNAEGIPRGGVKVTEVLEYEDDVNKGEIKRWQKLGRIKYRVDSLSVAFYRIVTIVQCRSGLGRI